MALFKPKRTLTINVAGMTCEHCEKRVAEAALAIEGVKKAKADRERGVLEVTVAGKQDGLVDRIVAAVNETGYEASA